MTNFLLRAITSFFLVLIVGFIFLYQPIWFFSGLLFLILLEILFLEWPKIAQNNFYIWLLAVPYLILPVWLLILLNQAGQTKLLGLLLVVVPVFDMGAYLFGKALGKHKLCPKVSPNKTWEGVWGGFLGVLLILLSATFCEFKNLINLNIACINSTIELMLGAKILLLAVIITALATLGDLFESWLKRCAGVKDSGRVLPGHGGFLDRIDGIIFVTFFFYFFKNFILTTINA